jgi:tryptophan synthase alpha chain
MARTVDYVRDLERAGVDLVELGVPFSDPLADGPANQASAARALEAGMTFAGVLDTLRAIRGFSEIPLVLYSYLNPLLAHGFEDSMRRIHEVGGDGVLALDLPPEEARTAYRVMAANGIDPVCLVTPTSTDARIRRIVRHARGFVYCISRAGVTGARAELSDDAAGVLERTRRHTRRPLALGFGISSPETAAAAARLADAVVVGSALVQRLHETQADPSAYAKTIAWVRSLAQAIQESRHG